MVMSLWRTIGLNYLTSDRPLWFTLADCIASKLLTGRAPKIAQAIRFAPKGAQKELTPVAIAGNEEYRINPSKDDFYKRVIDLRRSIQKQYETREAEGADETELTRLDSDQLALKILANATSYGVFIELNVEDFDETVDVFQIHTATGSRKTTSTKCEKPGDFFHPLLGTLITGAARLMLAITERRLIKEGTRLGVLRYGQYGFRWPCGYELGRIRKARPQCLRLVRTIEPL